MSFWNKSSTTTTTTQTKTSSTSSRLLMSTLVHRLSTLNHTSSATCARQRKPGDVLSFSSQSPSWTQDIRKHHRPQQRHCPVNTQIRKTTCQSTENEGCSHGSRNAASEICCSYRYLFINDSVVATKPHETCDTRFGIRGAVVTGDLQKQDSACD